MGAEGVGDRLRAPPWNGPAHGVRGGGENDAEGGTQGLVEAQEGMGGQAGEERFRAFAAGRCQRFWRRESGEAEARGQGGRRRQGTVRAEGFGGEDGPAVGG